MITSNDSRRIVFNTIREIVLDVTSCSDCIEAFPNDFAPEGTYATIQVVKDTTSVYGATVKQESVDKDNIRETVKYYAQWSVIVDFYREGAMKMANALQNVYYLSSVQRKLLRNKIGILKISQVRNTTALQSSNYEERATVILTVSGTMSITETTPIIKSTSVIIEDEKENKLMESTIDINTVINKAGEVRK